MLPKSVELYYTRRVMCAIGDLYGRGIMSENVLEEKVFHKVMRNVPFGLVVTREGRRRKVYYVNRTACQIMGYDKEEYVRRVERGWADFMNINLRELIRDNIDQIRAGEPFEVLSRTKTKNGEYKWLLSQVVVRLMEGSTCYVSFMDVTNRIEQEQKRLREQEFLREMATRDSFTKLLNRGTMEERIKAALENQKLQQEHAYIALDVDNFKQINDSYGHGMGDMLILTLAKALNEAFGEESDIGRMGGDEFAVFVKNVASRGEVCERARSVMDNLRAQMAAMNLLQEATVSIGIAFAPEAGVCFRELYERADQALYQVKKKNKNGIAVYQFS